MQANRLVRDAAAFAMRTIRRTSGTANTIRFLSNTSSPNVSASPVGRPKPTSGLLDSVNG